MKRVPLQSILDMSPEMKTGYVAECLSLGELIDGDMVEFDDETYMALVAKHRVKDFDPTTKGCCG